MKSHRRKASKRKYTSPLLIMAIAVVAVVIIALAFYFRTTSNTLKKPASKYFEITNVSALASSIQDGVKITMIGFNLTAVEGDAHNVYVSIDGLITQDPSQNVLLIGNLKKGESYAAQEVHLIGYVTHLQEEGYPFEIRVYSSETDSRHPEILVYIPPEKVIVIG